MDHAPPSTSQAQAAVGGGSPSPTDSAPVTLSERSLLALALLRIVFGFLWFQQLAWKMPPTFGGLRQDVEREVHHTILPGYQQVIEQVLRPFARNNIIS